MLIVVGQTNKFHYLSPVYTTVKFRNLLSTLLFARPYKEKLNNYATLDLKPYIARSPSKNYLRYMLLNFADLENRVSSTAYRCIVTKK